MMGLIERPCANHRRQVRNRHPSRIRTAMPHAAVRAIFDNLNLVFVGGALPPLPAHAAAPSELQRSEEHTSELQSLMRISYAVFCLKKKKHKTPTTTNTI